MIRSSVAFNGSGTSNETQYCNKGFTKEALAGLQSTEDFTSVKLKSSSSDELVYQPYTDFMLIRIKGRRHCQPRVIKPVLSSINNSDCYILKAASTVYLYIGQNANIIERSKANAIFDYLRAKRELGANSADIRFVHLKSLDLIDKSLNSPNETEFVNCLKVREQQYHENEEDMTELYELVNVYEMVNSEEVENIEDTNHDDDDDERVLLSHYRAERVKNVVLLSHSLLSDNNNKVFLFDFGTEFYVWSGSNASLVCKRAAMLLGKDMFHKGVCVSSSTSTSQKMINRPEWAIFTRQIQNMETVLFKEKFFDWPAASVVSAAAQRRRRSPITQVKEQVILPSSYSSSSSNSSSRSASSTTSPRDPFTFEVPSDAELKSLIEQRDTQKVNLVLEQTNLGRGNHYFDAVERRSFDIVTEQVNMYTLVNTQLVECDQAQFGHLVTTNSYLIKWRYKVNAVGFRTLKGDLSRHNLITGRDRYALFYWHGNKSSSAEKGTSALLSLDLLNHSLAASLGSSAATANNEQEEEESSNGVNSVGAASVPHVQVYQYKEPAAFCRLFNGSMCIELFIDHPGWRMFQIRGEIQEESHLVEIEHVSPDSLRSQTSFLFVNKQLDKSFIYHGVYSSQLHRELIVACASKYLKSNRVVDQVSQGDVNEWDMLIQVFPGFNRQKLPVVVESEYQYTPRLFLMSTLLHGRFEMTEIENPTHTSEHYCPFPFHQFHLYETARQPALFMLDLGKQIYLWQGWFDDNESDTTTTDGSTRLRFMQMRKCAMSTALKYWQVKMQHHHDNQQFQGKVVYAGLEPVEFINHFPAWSVNEQARASNMSDKLILDGQQDDIQDMLRQLNRSCYSLAELRERPLPDGVNPLKLECYLSDQEFEDLLQMNKESFANLPSWKQVNLKKKANLF